MPKTICKFCDEVYYGWALKYNIKKCYCNKCGAQLEYYKEE